MVRFHWLLLNIVLFVIYSFVCQTIVIWLCFFFLYCMGMKFSDNISMEECLIVCCWNWNEQIFAPENIRKVILRSEESIERRKYNGRPNICLTDSASDSLRVLSPFFNRGYSAGIISVSYTEKTIFSITL